MTTITSLGLGLIIFLIAHSGSVLSPNHDKPADGSDSYLKVIEKWRTDRLEEVNGEGGWTTLVGLFWLKEGRNRLGSNPSNDIVLSTAPEFAGYVELKKGATRLEADPATGITRDGQPASSLTLLSDADGKPTILKLGSLTLFVIKRGDRLGLRVKDKNHPARINFKGLTYFPLDANLRINAKLIAHERPTTVPIVNVLGMVDQMVSPGVLVFTLNGEIYRLHAVVEKGSTQLFIIFADQTNGKETYGAGRYLYAEPPDSSGNVVMDFNKAHNPSCAFTKYATCPLPPPQNRLAVRIEAGEKRYAGAEH